MASAVPPAELQWLAPDATGGPREVLQRIEYLCATRASLFEAAFVVLATHPTVPRPRLAQALRQFHPEATAFSEADVVGMLAAAVNGAQQAFEAVQRTRRGAERKASALPFVRPD